MRLSWSKRDAWRRSKGHVLPDGFVIAARHAVATDAAGRREASRLDRATHPLDDQCSLPWDTLLLGEPGHQATAETRVRQATATPAESAR